MMRVLEPLLVVLVVALTMSLTGSGGVRRDPPARVQCRLPKPESGYLEYADFQAIVEAFGLLQARPANGMSEATFRLWSQGQLRVPDNPGAGLGVEADLDPEVVGLERALRVRWKGLTLLLVARRSGSGWAVDCGPLVLRDPNSVISEAQIRSRLHQVPPDILKTGL